MAMLILILALLAVGDAKLNNLIVNIVGTIITLPLSQQLAILPPTAASPITQATNSIPITSPSVPTSSLTTLLSSSTGPVSTKLPSDLSTTPKSDVTSLTKSGITAPGFPSTPPSTVATTPSSDKTSTVTTTGLSGTSKIPGQESTSPKSASTPNLTKTPTPGPPSKPPTLISIPVTLSTGTTPITPKGASPITLPSSSSPPGLSTTIISTNSPITVATHPSGPTVLSGKTSAPSRNPTVPGLTGKEGDMIGEAIKVFGGAARKMWGL